MPIYYDLLRKDEVERRGIGMKNTLNMDSVS